MSAICVRVSISMTASGGRVERRWLTGRSPRAGSCNVTWKVALGMHDSKHVRVVSIIFVCLEVVSAYVGEMQKPGSVCKRAVSPQRAFLLGHPGHT